MTTFFTNLLSAIPPGLALDFAIVCFAIYATTKLNGFHLRFLGLEKSVQKMDEKFDKIHERFDKIGVRFDKVDGGEKNDARFDKMEQDMNGKFEKVDERFERFDQVIAGLDSKFDRKFDRINDKLDGIAMYLLDEKPEHLRKTR